MFASDTPLATPTGWTTVASICDGDILFDGDGQPVPVTGVGTWVLPPAAWRIEFDDGAALIAAACQRWHTITADERWLATMRSDAWRARIRDSRARERAQRTGSTTTLRRYRPGARPGPPMLERPTGMLRTTDEISESLTCRAGFGANHRLDLAQPLQLPEKQFSIHPYLLGRSIGGDPLETHEQVRWQRTPPPEPPDGPTLIRRPLGCSANRSPLLHDYGYLRASITQRTYLLQGLMDAAGGRVPVNRYGFWAYDKQLVDDIHDLVAGLGFKAARIERTATRPPQHRYDIVWPPRHDGPNPFRDLRLAASIPAPNHRRATWRYVVRCERVAPLPMRSITVEGGTLLAGHAMVPAAAG